jgi:acetyl-CoA acetyltransferase
MGIVIASGERRKEQQRHAESGREVVNIEAVGAAVGGGPEQDGHLADMHAGGLLFDSVLVPTGPIAATRKLLERNDRAIGDIDAIEVNEASAPVVAAWHWELRPDIDRVDVSRGATAIGHPLGSGARLLSTPLHELERTDKSLRLVTPCCARAIGTRTLIERP